jgi:hypothetical protein
MCRWVSRPAQLTGLPNPIGSRNCRSPPAWASIAVIGLSLAAPDRSFFPVGCCWMMRSAMAVSQKPETIAAIACSAA